MAMESKKCAMKNCNCSVPKGEEYCSTYCENAKDVTTLKCECGHSGCMGSKL